MLDSGPKVKEWESGAWLMMGGFEQDDGDHGPHPADDEIPTGLAKGMERYLRRGVPPGNGQAVEVLGVKGRM